MQRCQLDDHNPHIKEWGVFAVRNLCEGCDENQAFIARIERTPREVVNPDLLEKAGLELQVDRQSGKVQLKRPDATAAAGAPRPPAAATIEEEPVAESWDKEGSASGRTLE